MNIAIFKHCATFLPEHRSKHDPRRLAKGKKKKNRDRGGLKIRSCRIGGDRVSEEGSAILAKDYVELNPGRGRAPVTLNFSLDFLI